MSLEYLRLVELKLEDAGVHISAQRAMELMRNLHSCLCWNGEKEKALRMIEEPSSEQAKICRLRLRSDAWDLSKIKR
ncbi:MAG: hypothetical protein EOL98_11020 [Negativicutes bacterium]|nr:hypothetical protein [Negativicutes bacterium]